MFLKYLGRFFKVIMWILLSIFGLVLLVVIALQLPPVQRMVAGKVSAYMSQKTGTRFEVGKVDLAFPLGVELRDVYIEDQKHDTLAAGRKLGVAIDPIALFSKKIEIRNVTAEGLVAHITRSMPDSSFNFDFIVKSFAPDSTAVPADTTASPWEVSVKNIDLTNVALTYNDRVAGTDASFRIGYLETEIETFDLEKMHFGIGDVELNNSYASIVQSKASNTQDTAAASPLVLDLGTIAMANVKLDYNDKVLGQHFLVDLGKSEIEGDKIDVVKQYVAFKEINISDTKAFIDLGIVSPADSLVAQAKEEGTPGDRSEWVVRTGRIDLRNNALRLYREDNATMPANVIDPNDLMLTALNVQVDNFNMKGTDVTAEVKNISAKDKSGFELRKLAARLAYNTKGVELADLDLQTNKSHIGNYIKITYPSIDEIGKHPGELGINAQFRQTVIGFSDILMLDTAMSSVPAIAGNAGSVMKLSGDIKGQVKDLALNNVQVTTRYSTHVQVSGTIKGLPDINRTVFNLNIPNLTTSASDIRAFVPDSFISPSISIPPMISMRGSFKGTMKEFTTVDSLNTSFGIAALALNMDTIPGNELYKGYVRLTRFNMGKLLKQEKTLGNVTAAIDFNGAGLNPDSMEAIVKGNVKEITANNYTYKGLTLDASIKDQTIRASAAMRDSNLSFALESDLNISKEQPAYSVRLFLDGADLHDMNFTKDNVKVQGILEADLTGKDINNLEGTVDIRNVLVIKNEKRFTIDSLLYATLNSKDNTDITIRSSIVNAEIKGGIRLPEIPGAISDHLAGYFDPAIAAKPDTSTHAQDLSFNIDVRDPDLVSELFAPGLKMSPGTINGKFDKKTDKLDMYVDMPRITFSDTQFDSLQAQVNTNENGLSYNISISEVLGGSFHVNKTTVHGDVSNGRMHSAISIVDKDKTGHQLMLAGTTAKVNEVFQLHLDSVVLNNTPWSVSDDNYIAFRKEGPYFHNVRWDHDNSYLAINSIEPSKMQIDFREFDLGQVTGIVAIDKPMVTGVASGGVVLNTAGEKPVFTTNMTVKDFAYLQDTLGLVTVKADNLDMDRYNLELSVHEKGNDMLITGFVMPGAKENGMDLNLDAKQINLATLRSFTMGQLYDLAGTATATVKITGTTSNPEVNGEMLFKEAGFKPAYVNSYYSVNNEKIRLDKNGIYFDSFVLTDTLGHKAEVNGAAYTGNFKDYQFDLEVNTRNFLALNTSAKDNELYYGTVFLDSRIHIGGSNTRPEVEIFAKLDKGSSLTFVIPEEVLAEVDREGIVQFVDFNNDLNPVLNSDPIPPDSVVKPVTEIALTANVEIDEQSQFRIVVDPRTGDSLYVRGNSAFSLGIDPSGKISLIGTYDIVEGSYQLSFGNIVRKKFYLQRGSRISWSGDPIAAELDLKAESRVRTSPEDLISDQVTGMTQEELDRTRQQLQFIVRLNMTGKLLTPKIDFDIDLPPDQRDALNGTVYTRLLQLNEQESELNQQVFALIILNRFLPQNPLDAQGSSQTAVATAVRGSASKVITQQLNKFTAGYIKLVDINFNLDSYQDELSTGPQGVTNLQVDMRKDAFDERLRIDMGGNLMLEGPQNTTGVGSSTARTGSDNSNNNNNQASDLASDVSVEYKLTRDGRYRLRGLRKTGYVGVFEGRLTETGIGVIFARDYNRFRDLFVKPKEEGSFKEIK